MSKCDICKKSITKSLPGVECSKCEKIVHLNTKCSGLTNKQIVALKAASSLEWTCLDCQRDSPRRNSSIVIPEEDDDGDDTPVQINAKKLLNKITTEVEKAIKNEMRELNESLQFHSAKLEEVVECIDAFKQSIKVLERKNVELMNRNINLETRVGALEQRLHEIEQEKLINCVEIANVSYPSTEDLSKIVESVAIKLKQPLESVKNSQRLPGKKDQPMNIKVELKDESDQEKWILAAKSSKIIVADICPNEKNNHNSLSGRVGSTEPSDFESEGTESAPVFAHLCTIISRIV
ncbi:jg6123 [Pararge aegeria aegeria]|uniref:Jg6123 protein n=1 Tax=Pararge aegeria aegeria TaxID=348720 RepID=A0A8S4RCH9_9NEOP|nr:jg6123 [Pararge aegeria aegeria]